MARKPLTPEYKKIREQRATVRRRLLRESGYTRDEAKKMAYWGDERIAKETGLIVPVEKYVVPPKTLKTYTIGDKREIVKARQNRRRRVLKERGYTSNMANRMKKWSDDRVFKHILEKKMPKVLGEEDYDKRLRKWVKWSDKNSKLKFPSVLLDYAKEVNKSFGKKSDDKIGFAVVYYWYTRGGTIESWWQRTKPDPHDPKIYIPPVVFN